MSNKIKYSTKRSGEFNEFELNCTTIILPNGVEFGIAYDPVRKGLQLTKIWGANDDSTIFINPCTSNQIIII